MKIEPKIEAAFERLDPALFLPNSTNYAHDDSTLKHDSTDARNRRAISTYRAADGVTLSAISDRDFMAQIATILSPLDGKRIFEIGCGTGYFAYALAELGGPTSEVYGCEIIRDLYNASQSNPLILAKAQLRLAFGDFVDVLPELGTFDVVLATSSMSSLRPELVGAVRPDGGLLACPIEVPGGGDCFAVFKRSGNVLKVQWARMSVSVPTTGRYSDSPAWARSITDVIPNFSNVKKLTINTGQISNDSIRQTLGFRSFLMLREPSFVAVNMGDGILRYSSHMAFGLVDRDTASCCLQQGDTLVLAGLRGLALACRFKELEQAWHSEARPTMSDLLDEIRLSSGITYQFHPVTSGE